MLARLKRLDAARLAGTGCVLGIDLDATTVRIVPVKKRGGLLDKYKGNFSADAPLACDFPPTTSAEAKGAIIKDALLARHIKTHHCVAALRSPGVRTVSFTVPPSVQEIGEWIAEHAAKILKIPIPLSELELRWNVLETSLSSGSLVEVTFVRKTDLEEVRKIVKAAGLTPLGLSGGAGDVLNALFVNEPDVGEKALVVAYAESLKVTLLPLVRGKRKPITAFPNGLDERARRQIEENVVLCWAGARSFAEILPQDRELKPYNLTPDYALAAGLALKGFLPELQPVDFLSEAEHERNTLNLWQVGFTRSAIALGSILFLLLALQAALSFALGQASEQLDYELSSSEGVTLDVAALRELVSALQSQIKGSRSGASSGNLSALLHQLASSVPASVRIDRIQVEARQATSMHLTLSVSAKSREAVTAFLKQLQQSGFSDVTLLRLSATGAAGLGGSTSMVVAEMEASITREALP